VELAEIEFISCQSLEIATRVRNPWGVPEERDVAVLVCRGPSLTPQELWQRVGEAQWG